MAPILSTLVLSLSAFFTLSSATNCKPDSDSYDFIVVGGGTAGLALATRLSHGLPNDCIVVIEAGPSAPGEPRINIPGRKGSTLGTSYDWNFTTVPQPELLNRLVSQNRGKVLGGSSALNLMTWDRGAVADYDAWEAFGNTGWNWKNFIAAMLKVENFVKTDNRYGSAGVGKGGPIQTLINRIIPEQQRGFIPALNSLGIPENRESLGGNPIGVMYQPSNIRQANYTRSYSPQYLWLAGPNVQVLESTTVATINLSNGNKKKATGVSLASGKTIKAKKEVILAAGAFQSPQLLELSGIGQPDVLSAAGIQMQVNLPGVGENLQDHIRIQNSYKLKEQYTSFDELRTNATYAAEQLALYEANKVSEYDYTGSGYTYMTWKQALGTDSALVALAKQSAERDSVVDQRKLAYYTNPSLANKVPELEVIFSDGYTGVRGPPPVGAADYDSHFFTLIAVVMHPFSRGSTHINASTPAGKPIINPNYLSKPYDLRAIVEATKYARRIAQTDALKGFWTEEYEPGLAAVNTDAEWEEFARNTTLSIYHPLGTCAMLPKARGGVVDADLKVYGVEGLRVVDSSVIPVQPSAHLQTMVYGIAELAAGRIVGEYR